MPKDPNSIPVTTPSSKSVLGGPTSLVVPMADTVHPVVVTGPRPSTPWGFSLGRRRGSDPLNVSCSFQERPLETSLILTPTFVYPFSPERPRLPCLLIHVCSRSEVCGGTVGLTSVKRSSILFHPLFSFCPGERVFTTVVYKITSLVL